MSKNLKFIAIVSLMICQTAFGQFIQSVIPIISSNFIISALGFVPVSSSGVTSFSFGTNNSQLFWNSLSGKHITVLDMQYHNSLEDIIYYGDQQLGALSFRAGGQSSGNTNARITLGFLDNNGNETNMFGFKERGLQIGANTGTFNYILAWKGDAAVTSVSFGNTNSANVLVGTSLYLSPAVTAASGINVSGGNLVVGSNNINADGSGNLGSVTWDSDGNYSGIGNLTFSGVGTGNGSGITNTPINSKALTNNQSSATTFSNNITVDITHQYNGNGAGLTNVNKFAITTNSGTSTATNGYSSDSIHFSKPPTNSPTDAYVWTATGTSGDGAWKVGGSASTGIVTNGGTGTNNVFTTAVLSGTTTLTNGSTYIGLLNFVADTGGPFVDISVTATTSAGTNIGYTNRVDGNDLEQIFGKSDGAGATTNLTVRFPQGLASGISNALPLIAIIFPATTVNWTNTFRYNIIMYIDNTGVTGSVVKKNSTTIASSILAGDLVTMPMKPGDYFSETYTVGTPTGNWEPW